MKQADYKYMEERPWGKFYVIQETNWMIENYKMEFDWLLGFAYMIRGKTFDKLGMNEMALKDYKSILKLNNYFPEVDEAKKLIKERQN